MRHENDVSVRQFDRIMMSVGIVRIDFAKSSNSEVGGLSPNGGTSSAGGQSHGMAKCLEFARPMVRRCARLNADQTRRQLLEERQDRAALQLAADNHLTSGINSANLEDRLGDVETDCRDRLHGSLL
jgi:hypothetical protein